MKSYNWHVKQTGVAKKITKKKSVKIRENA